ncbi:glycosyltransferase family 61 protein [Halomonas elongata]|uniref:glycosyltransferase family 61 protein n=1 Tax=Halomonas elongata TaxID=2746 RepID=UPI0023B08D74|nr:glycosyltransferase family 61 protein [Halomonas elongata]
MNIEKTPVKKKRSISYKNDFPYKHPRVSIGEEVEPDVNVYTIESPLVCIGIKKAFYCTETGRFYDEISSKPAVSELKNKKNNVKEIKGHILDLVSPGANLYSHWLLDLLPKLSAVKQAGYNLEDFDYVYVNYYNSKFKEETFEKLGIPVEKVLDFPSAPKIFKCSKITTVSACRNALYTPQWAEEFVRSIFLETNIYNQVKKNRRIYISRSKGETRRVLNEASLVRKISPLGFEVLYCEDHSVTKVAEIMSEAEIVIAPHGAGLANIVFCNSRVKIVELFSAHMSPEYYKISKKNGFDYLCIQALSPDGEYVDFSTINYEHDRPVLHPMNLLLSEENMEKIVSFVSEE